MAQAGTTWTPNPPGRRGNVSRPGDNSPMTDGMPEIPDGIHFSWPGADVAICGADVGHGTGELTAVALETTCRTCLTELAACGEWPGAADKLRILYAEAAEAAGPVQAAPPARQQARTVRLSGRPQVVDPMAIGRAAPGPVQVLRRPPGAGGVPRPGGAPGR